MKTYKRWAETVERQSVESVTCDWCGRPVGEPPHRFRVRIFTLSFESGDVFPEGCSTEGWEVQDLCDDCIVRLRSLLEQNGVRVVPTEKDW